MPSCPPTGETLQGTLLVRAQSTRWPRVPRIDSGWKRCCCPAFYLYQGDGRSSGDSKNGNFKDWGEGTWLSSSAEEKAFKIAWIIWIITLKCFHLKCRITEQGSTWDGHLQTTILQGIVQVSLLAFSRGSLLKKLSPNVVGNAFEDKRIYKSFHCTSLPNKPKVDNKGELLEIKRIKGKRKACLGRLLIRPHEFFKLEIDVN